MSTIYVIFQSATDDHIRSSDCTTRWPDTILCSIPLSGLYDDYDSTSCDQKITNLMIMTGDETEIRDWISENEGKVFESNEEEMNLIGQSISPEGSTIVIIDNEDGTIYEKTYTASEFTITDGQTWTLTNTEDITS